MARRLRLAAGAMVLVAATVGACGSGDGGGAAQERALLDRGRQVYAESCASCHGADLRGTDQGPSHLSEVYEPSHHGDAAFRSAIENGSPAHHWAFGDMAPVEGLSDADIDAVIAFIRAEQQREGFEPYPPQAPPAPGR